MLNLPRRPLSAAPVSPEAGPYWAAGLAGSPPKILLVANTGWYLYNFRLPLARLLRSRRAEVMMVSPRDQYVDRLQAEGFRWIELALDRRSMNPWRELMVIFRLARIYLRERPRVVHHFTIKCLLYGTIAACLSGVGTIVNSVTGLGHLAVADGKSVRLLRPLVNWLYRYALTAPGVKVIFENPDDLQVFKNLGLVIPDCTALIRGVGVDLQRFSPRNVPLSDQPIVLFAGRLIADKGIIEFVEAARRLRSRGVRALFQIAGNTDPGNPSTLSSAMLAEWQREGTVQLLGHMDAIEEWIAAAALVVLPTHGEGVPRVLLEAAAMGKPVVATDVPGCREVVDDGLNGLLVPVRDTASLAAAIERLLDNPDLRAQMGMAGRAKMLREFDDQEIARRTVETYGIPGILYTARK